MRLSFWNWLLALSFFACSWLARAEAADSSWESFQALLDRIISNDARYQRELSVLDGEAASVMSMKKAWEPKVDLQLQRSASRTFGRASGNETLFGTQADMIASWNLYAFGLDQNRQDFIEKQKSRITEAKSLKKLEAEQRAANLILDGIEASQLAQIAKKQQDNRTRLLLIQEKRKSLGLTSAVDLDILKINQASSDLLASDAEQILAVKKAEIALASGNLDGPDSWPLAAEFFKQTTELERWINNHKDTEPRVLRVDRSLIVENEAALGVARKSYGPSIDLVMQMSRALDQREEELLPQSYVALTFNMPLLDRGQRLQASSRAEIQVKESRYSFDYDRNKMAIELLSSSKIALQYQKNIEKLNEMVGVAEKVYNSNQSRYEKALINQLELYQSEVLFYGSQESRISAIKKWYQQMFSFCFMVGEEVVPCLKSI